MRTDRTIRMFQHKLDLFLDFFREKQIVTILESNKITTAFQQAPCMIFGHPHVGLMKKELQTFRVFSLNFSLKFAVFHL